MVPGGEIEVSCWSRVAMGPLAALGRTTLWINRDLAIATPRCRCPTFATTFSGLPLRRSCPSTRLRLFWYYVKINVFTAMYANMYVEMPKCTRNWLISIGHVREYLRGSIPLLKRPNIVHVGVILSFQQPTFQKVKATSIFEHTALLTWLQQMPVYSVGAQVYRCLQHFAMRTSNASNDNDSFSQKGHIFGECHVFVMHSTHFCVPCGVPDSHGLPGSRECKRGRCKRGPDVLHSDSIPVVISRPTCVFATLLHPTCKDPLYTDPFYIPYMGARLGHQADNTLNPILKPYTLNPKP